MLLSAVLATVLLSIAGLDSSVVAGAGAVLFISRRVDVTVSWGGDEFNGNGHEKQSWRPNARREGGALSFLSPILARAGPVPSPAPYTPKSNPSIHIIVPSVDVNSRNCGDPAVPCVCSNGDFGWHGLESQAAEEPSLTSTLA